MSKVKALRTCFVGSYRSEGEVFDYDGPKNRHLEPVKESKEKAEPTDSRE